MITENIDETVLVEAIGTAEADYCVVGFLGSLLSHSGQCCTDIGF